MKKILFVLFLMPLLCQAQTITAKIAPKPKIALVIPQNQIFKLDKVQDTILTTNKAIYQKIEYPVYAIKSSGKLYIGLNSKKTGKYYRKYIKQEQI